MTVARAMAALAPVAIATGCAVLPIGTGSATRAPAEAAAPVVLPPDAEAVRVGVASGPISVPTPHGTVVAYEIVIANSDTIAAVIVRAESLDPDRNTVLAAYDAHDSDRWVAAHTERAGAPGAAAGQVPAGDSVVMFWWIHLPADFRVPARIAHRVAQPRETIAIDLPAEVDTTPPPLLSAPFYSGTWWIAGGLANDAPPRRAFTLEDGVVMAPGRFATEWVKVNDELAVARVDGAENDEWFGYTDPVLAVAPGRVVFARDGVPDQPPGEGTGDGALGNTLIIELPGAGDEGRLAYVVYGHLRAGSLRVTSGDVVQTGAYIAQVGNSGDSRGPRLHLSVFRGEVAAPGRPTGQGLPFLLDDFRVTAQHPEDAARPAGPTGRHRNLMPERGNVIQVRP